MANAKLEIVNMTKLYSNGDGVKNINISVEEGELITLLGPSGCGKTTILRAIGGFNDIQSGDILIDGKSIINMPPEKRPTAMVFQSYNLWPHMSVFDNMEFGLKLRKVPKPERKQRITEMLEMIKMPGVEKKYPGQMSGGEQQRCAVARALANTPDILLADEPTGSLDPNHAIVVFELLLDLVRKNKMAMLFVTHDMSLANRADRRITIKNGIVK